MLHPLSTPGQLLGLLALGLMLGLKAPDWFGLSWLAFALAALVGICLRQLGVAPIWGETALLLIAAVAGAFAALYPAGLFVLFIVLMGAGGLLIGALSTPDLGPLQATIITLAGSFAGADLALIYVSGGVGWLRERFKQQWLRIGLRVIAAWIAAISILSALLAIATTRS